MNIQNAHSVYLSNYVVSVKRYPIIIMAMSYGKKNLVGILHLLCMSKKCNLLNTNEQPKVLILKRGQEIHLATKKPLFTMMVFTPSKKTLL